jgi:hypothetical protein
MADGERRWRRGRRVWRADAEAVEEIGHQEYLIFTGGTPLAAALLCPNSYLTTWRDGHDHQANPGFE